MSLRKPSSGQKRKHKVLTLHEKLAFIEKLEKGASVACVCMEYGIAKQIVSDIRKKNNEILKFLLNSNVEKEKSETKRMRLSGQQNLDEAVYKWFTQLRANGLAVRGIEIQAAAQRLAKQFGLNDFKASSGWLFRFRRRHNLGCKKICGESLSGDFEAVKLFRQELDGQIKTGINLNQLYNMDETGLFWRSLPENTQASKSDRNTPGRKISKERVSALLCANADGSHVLKPVIVGKSKKPRAIKDIMDKLPVHYYNSKNAWFTSNITVDWFHNKAVPEIRRYQMEDLKIPANKVKALILLDNATSHSEITSKDGNIKCKFLPRNTTSLIQPMDQGIIYAAKRFYKKRFLDEILEVEEPVPGEEDNRGKRTLMNLKLYNLRSMILNFAAAVKDVKISTLANCWKKLLLNDEEEVVPDTSGCETQDFYEKVRRGGEEETSLEGVEAWLDADEDDPGYQILTEEEIVDNVMGADDSEDEEEGGEDYLPKVKLSEVKEHLNYVIHYVERNENENVSAYYDHLRHLRELINKEIVLASKISQRKIDSFFKRVSGEEKPGPSGQC